MNSTSDALIGPCPSCGKAHTFKRIHSDDPFWKNNPVDGFDPFSANHDEWISHMECVQDELMRDNTSASRFIHNIAQRLICPSCLQLTEKTRDAWIANQKQQKAAEFCQNNGLWIAAFIEHQFQFCDKWQREHSQDSWNKAESWDITKPNLWIYGHPGRGKTFLAHCIMNRELQRANTICHQDCLELDREGRTFDWQKKIKHLKDVDILLLDDLDKCDKPESYMLVLDVLNARNNSKRRTFVTANKSPEAFVEYLKLKFQSTNPTVPGALIQRLSWRNCSCLRLEVKGEIMRKNDEK